MGYHKMYGTVDASNTITEFKMLWEGSVSGMTLLKDNSERNERGSYQLKKSVDGIQVYKWEWNSPSIDEISDSNAKYTNVWRETRKNQLIDSSYENIKNFDARKGEHKAGYYGVRQEMGDTLTGDQTAFVNDFKTHRTLEIGKFLDNAESDGIFPIKADTTTSNTTVVKLHRLGDLAVNDKVRIVDEDPANPKDVTGTVSDVDSGTKDVTFSPHLGNTTLFAERTTWAYKVL